MKVVKIEDWSIVDREWFGIMRDPINEEFRYFLPGFTLHGKVFGHPRVINGHRAHTSKILTINGNIVTTESETIYELGEPSKAYTDWLDNEVEEAMDLAERYLNL